MRATFSADNQEYGSSALNREISPKHKECQR